MSRPRGGLIGVNATPAATALNSAASGVWTLREAEALTRGGTWPFTAPGGVGAGLQVWLDAASQSVMYDATSSGNVVTANGAAIARWEDRSGNANHATQGTVSYRPTLTTNAKNGLPVVTFDGVNDFMAHAANIPAPATTFAVARLTSAGTSGYEGLFAACPPNGTIGSVIAARSNGSSNWGAYVDSWKASSYSIRNKYSVLTAIARATSPDTFRTNGIAENQSWGARTTFTDGYTRQYIGGESAAALAGGNMKGDVCEIIAYTRVLSDNEISAVESYLATKWGIS